ncbi:MAG: transcriptional regulator, TetR family [Rhizobacter sp.]|nr:transcriptional regulator, TetR family [Rhizobacter sp.]
MASVKDRAIGDAMHTADVEWDELPPSVRAAVGRALARQQRDAVADVEQILDAALRVAERVAPSEPKVADIVAEAGTSNQTFYRYFAGKSDLMAAVQERGIVRLRSYLARRMDRHENPDDRVAAWVEGLLAQVTSPATARQSVAVAQELQRDGATAGEASLLDHLGALLAPTLARAGNANPALDARALQDVVLGVVRRHALAATSPSAEERAHVIDFCLGVVGRDAARRH